MKLIKKSRLWFKQGKSDKVYEVDLCELAGLKDDRYVVNFRYGRRGHKLRESSKTPAPVNLATAEKLFDSVVISKTNKGYQDSEQPAPASALHATPKLGDGVAKQALVAALLTKLRKEPDSKLRSRFIWRLGELADEQVGAELVKYIRKGHWLEDYSIAWALGRLRAKNQLSDLDALLRSQNHVVRQIAFEAQLQLSDDSARQSLLNSHYQQLPETVRTAIAGGDAAIVQQQLAIAFKNEQIDANELLSNCYQLALLYPVLHRALQSQLELIPFAPGYFRGVRAVYKIAEFRLDGPIFALLTRRIETTRHYFRNDWDWAWIPGSGTIKPSKELKKPDSRLAYSNRTRDYLRRRSWRSLKRLGTCGDLHYVDMATEMLLAVRDEHGEQPRRSEVYRWVRAGRSWERQLISSNEYGSFAAFLTFSHILYENSERYKLAASGRAWYKTDAADDNVRTECFPELWEQKPRCALRLLKQSRCAPVHLFARRLLEALPDFSEDIDADDIAELLCSPYGSTCEFALNLAKEHLQDSGGDETLLLALLRSTFAAARELGLASLQQRAIGSDDIDFLSELLLIQQADVQRTVLEHVQTIKFSGDEQAKLLQKLVAVIFDDRTDNLTDAHAAQLAAFAENRLGDAVQVFPLTLIERLLTSSNTGKQLFGARLLVGHSIAFNDIPERMFKHIQGSPSPLVRAVAAALLGKQADEALAQQIPLLVDLYSQGDVSERSALLAILERLVGKNADWAGRVMRALIDLTFKAETEEGQRRELTQFFEQHLANELPTLDQNLVWRLLQAKSAMAQSIGALALARRPIADFSVKQWALLARHADVAVRQRAFAAFKSNVASTRQHRRDALLLLDSDWDDSREFGFDFFRQYYTDEDWEPETVVYLCDSVREDVQSFGREILQRFFKEEQGADYLLKLSQHPSNNVQLFVTNFLEDYASDQPERILELQNYFVTALSQVNKGRICKDRVLTFLLNEAKKYAEVAQLAAQIFARISLTVVHKDKAALIKAMLQLQTVYPDLPLPVVMKTAAIKMSA